MDDKELQKAWESYLLPSGTVLRVGAIPWERRFTYGTKRAVPNTFVEVTFERKYTLLRNKTAISVVCGENDRLVVWLPEASIGILKSPPYYGASDAGFLRIQAEQFDITEGTQLLLKETVSPEFAQFDELRAAGHFFRGKLEGAYVRNMTWHISQLLGHPTLVLADDVMPLPFLENKRK